MDDHETIELYKRLYNLTDDDFLHKGDTSEREIVLAAVADYRADRAGAFEIVADCCALIIIDMQVGFVDRASPQWVPQAERIVPRLSQVATSARERDIPVIFSSAQFLDPSPTDIFAMSPAIAEGNLAEGTRGVEIVGELWRDGDVLIDSKHTYDAFFGTDLDYHLRGLKKDTIVIAGTLTNFCCEATARAGFDRGYHVVLLSDLCASDNPWAHDATMQTMRRGFGRVVDSDLLLAAWRRA